MTQRDPVCGMDVGPATAAGKYVYFSMEFTAHHTIGGVKHIQLEFPEQKLSRLGDSLDPAIDSRQKEDFENGKT